MYQFKRIAATGNLSVAAGDSELGTVNVNTGATSAVFTIYDGTSSAGVAIAVIDASSKSSHAYVVRCHSGIFGVLSGGNADVTVGYQ